MERVGEHDDEGMWLTADQSARHLGVKRETIYAYASRGMIRRASDGTRGSVFRRDDLERLVARGRKAPQNRGTRKKRPVLESGIALIRDDHLYLRGYDVSMLCESLRFEGLSELLWGRPLAELTELPDGGGSWSFPPRWRDAVEKDLDRFPLPLDRVVYGMAVLAGLKPAEGDGGQRRDLAEARRLLAFAVYCATGRTAEEDGGLARALGLGLLPRPCRGGEPEVAAGLVELALNLAAENGLAAPTVCARIVASVGGSMQSALLAGLTAMRGTAPGAAALLVERLLHADGPLPDCVAARRALAGGFVPGVGHLAFKREDPRSAILLARISADLLGRDGNRVTAGNTPDRVPCNTPGNTPVPVPPDGDLAQRIQRFQTVLEVLSAGEEPLNLDFALAALCYLVGLPEGSAEAIFAIARISGWVAHLLEQSSQGTSFRLEFVYTGPVRPGG